MKNIPFIFIYLYMELSLLFTNLIYSYLLQLRRIDKMYAA